MIIHLSISLSLSFLLLLSLPWSDKLEDRDLDLLRRWCRLRKFRSITFTTVGNHTLALFPGHARGKRGVAYAWSHGDYWCPPFTLSSNWCYWVNMCQCWLAPKTALSTLVPNINLSPSLSLLLLLPLPSLLPSEELVDWDRDLSWRCRLETKWNEIQY